MMDWDNITQTGARASGVEASFEARYAPSSYPTIDAPAAVR